MNDVQFITLNAGTKPTKDKRHGNLIQGNDGITYSYGSHYPLIVPCNGFLFRNVQGYSSSTSKHIGHAGAVTQYDYNHSYSDGKSTFDTYRYITTCLNNELTALHKELETLSKRAWKQKEMIEARINKIQCTIHALR